MDKTKQTQIIANNTKRLMALFDMNVTTLSKQAGVDHGTISKLRSEDTLPNPTVKIITGLANAFGIEPWMLLIENFPFNVGRNRLHLKSISEDGYIMLKVFESCDNETVRYALLEAAKQAIKPLDERASNQIADIQSTYLAKRSV